MKVTWKDLDSDLVRPLTIEKKIDIFYQQTLGWQLHIADLIANGGDPLGGGTRLPSIEHSGFAVLQICLSYFETIGKYRGLPGGSGANFRAGAEDVFPQIRKIPEPERSELLSALYKGGRCGLYHNSRTARGVGLGQPPGGKALAYAPGLKVLSISPERLPRVLKGHLEGYRAELLDPKNATTRQRFERQFDRDFGS
ncbi:MAG: hypothetical protein WCF30_09205 [Terracidiphilus sp.]